MLYFSPLKGNYFN